MPAPKGKLGAAASATSAEEGTVLQELLPVWTDHDRVVPDPLIRSGLFTVGSSEKRQFIQKELINSLSSYQITYTGQELQQDDLSVWLALIHLARRQAIGDSVFFTGYRLIKDLGWRMHSDTYNKIRACIERLNVTGLRISTPGLREAYQGALIRDLAWSALDGDGNACWRVRFEPTVVRLFQQDSTTLIEWELRKRIGNKATLALWLLSFYTADSPKPRPMPMEKLKELSGSRDTLSSFRRNMARALERLVKEQFLVDFSIENDMVRVTKASRSLLRRVV